MPSTEAGLELVDGDIDMNEVSVFHRKDDIEPSSMIFVLTVLVNAVFLSSFFLPPQVIISTSLPKIHI